MMPTSPEAENALLCRGTVIHNIELTPGRGGQLVRAAGTSAQLIGQVDRYSQVRPLMHWGTLCF